MCVIEEIFACGHRGVQGNKKCHDVHCAKGKSTNQRYDCAWCDPERKSLAIVKKQPSLDMGGVMKKNMAAEHGLTERGKVTHSKSAIWKEAKRSIEEARKSGEGEAGPSGEKKDYENKPKQGKDKKSGHVYTAMHALRTGQGRKEKPRGVIRTLLSRERERKDGKTKNSHHSKDKPNKRHKDNGHGQEEKEEEAVAEDKPVGAEVPANEAI